MVAPHPIFISAIATLAARKEHHQELKSALPFLREIILHERQSVRLEATKAVHRLALESCMCWSGCC
jgi:hypothetical protein